MSKEPSKSDQARALRERRYDQQMARQTAAKRGQPSPDPKPNWSWQRDAQPTAEAVKEVAAKALSRTAKKKVADPEMAKAVTAVAEQIARKKADKAAKQANREGKKPAMAWLDPGAAKALKMAAAKYDVTQEAIVAEGIALMLGDKYKV